MKVRFQADADLNLTILLATLRKESAIDFQTAVAAGLPGLPDAEVLVTAAKHGRVLVTHDRRTMPRFFGELISRQTSPGLLVVPQSLSVATAVEDLILIWSATEAEEWVNRMSVPRPGHPAGGRLRGPRRHLDPLRQGCVLDVKNQPGFDNLPRFQSPFLNGYTLSVGGRSVSFNFTTGTESGTAASLTRMAANVVLGSFVPAPVTPTEVVVGVDRNTAGYLRILSGTGSAALSPASALTTAANATDSLWHVATATRARPSTPW